MPINLGDKVKDKLSPLTGIVTGRTQYLYGCVHILVNPGTLKDGIPVDSVWIDEDRLELIEKAAIAAPAAAVATHAGCDGNNVSR